MAKKNVKLILLQDVENLGLAGKEVSVTLGYARNYLFPNGMAAKATPGSMKILEARKEKIEQQRREDLAANQELAAKINAIELSIPMQASDDDQLFGSVSARTLAEKLAENGIEVDHQRIKLEEPIKKLGSFEVEVKISENITAVAKVWVVRA